MKGSYFIVVLVLVCMIKHAHADGMGADIPTNLVCTPNSTDSSLAQCTFNTVLASDSEITSTIGGNTVNTWYDPTMCTPVAGVCPHTVNLNHLQPSITTVVFATACTHATFGNIGTICPRTSQDISSMGPIRLMSNNNRPQFTTIARPPGPVTSWFSWVQVPVNVFPAQMFFLSTLFGFGTGTIGGTGNVYWLLLHDVTIDTPSSGTWQCGTQNTTHNPQYWQLGATTGVVNCQSRLSVSPDNDFTIAMADGNSWVKNSTTLGLSLNYRANLFSSQNYGYVQTLVGTGIAYQSNIAVLPGKNIPPGVYTVHYHLQPLYQNGLGNEVGGAMYGQDHQLDATFNVIAATPLPKSPPASFPTWSFLGQYYASAAYWGTWNGSVTNADSVGIAPMATQNFSGLWDNLPFTGNNWDQSRISNYDGARNYFAAEDLLFRTTHPAWASGQTYQIGDMVTVAGTTYIMDAVGGASQPGLSGVSGANGTPNFTPGPSTFTADGALEWLSIGNQAYYNAQAILSGDAYRNVILLNQAKGTQEPSQFPVGTLMHFWRTKDAAAGGVTSSPTPTTIYTETNNKFGQGTSSALVSVDSLCLTANDSALVQTGTNTYWTGGDRLEQCYSASLGNPQFIYHTNDNTQGFARVKGLGLNQLDAYWFMKNDPTWINTDDGLRTKRMVDTAMATLDLAANVPLTAYAPAVLANGMMPSYQAWQLAEGLMHYYQATVYYSNTTLFPGTTVTPDERIPIVLKNFADYAWVHWFDRIYDANITVTDACNAAKPLICTNNNSRLHSYTIPYNPLGLSQQNVDFEFWTEASNSEYGWLYSWLWAYNSTMTIPANGRNPGVSTYADAAMLILAHGFDGRGCKLPTTTTPVICTSWSVKDFWHGGRTTGVNGGQGGWVSGPKEVNQVMSNTNAEGLKYLLGIFTWDVGAMNQSTNPCWIVANRNPDGSCNQPSPYPDVMTPYPLSFGANGNSPYNPEPQICVPGYTSRIHYCGTPYTVGNAKVIMDNSVGPTTAKLPWLTVKQTSACWVVIANPPSAVEPPAASLVEGQNKFSELPAHTPVLVGGTPLPLWFHTITMTGLTPNTLYHFGLYCQDMATPANTFNFVYQTGGSTGRFLFNGLEQAMTFSTASSPGVSLTTPHMGPNDPNLIPQSAQQKKKKKAK